MGPIKLPKGINQPNRKRRWVWLLLWTLLVFAGGVAVGPKVTEQAPGLVERACSMLGICAPRFAKTGKPTAPSILPLPAQDITTVPVPIQPVAQAPAVEAPTVAAKPVVAPPEKEAAPEKPAAVVAPQPPAPVAATAAAPARAEIAAVEPRSARGRGTKGGNAKTVAAAPTAPAAPEKKISIYHDPFATDDENAGEPKAAKRPKPTGDESAPKSHNSLDKNNDIDAMLKDVQKSTPQPAPKREAQPSLPPLSPADISRVMAGVKTRGNDCAQRLGAKGVAELKLAVAKDGKVTDVRVGGKLANTPLGACIEKAARAASFPPSSGLRFDYRIDVR
jgi:outer membrane biosynthesis protein TonB